MPSPAPTGAEAPRPPAALTCAAAVSVMQVPLWLIVQLLAFLTPDPYSDNRHLIPDPHELPWWARFLAPLAVLVLGILVREGRNAVRIALTVVMALFVLAPFSLVLDGTLDDQRIAGVVVMQVVLLALAVVLLYWPTSNAYVRHVRETRRAQPR